MKRNAYHWVERFQNGRTSVVGEDRSGRPNTSRTANSVERIIALVQEDRRITVTYVDDKMDISYVSPYSFIHKDLGYYKILKGGCQSSLHIQHKWERIEKCMQLL
jgi:hypothetical protein